MLEAHICHGQNMKKGYPDAEVDLDPVFQRQINSLTIEIIKAQDHDHLQWLDDRKHPERKILQMKNELETWCKNREELDVRLKEPQEKNGFNDRKSYFFPISFSAIDEGKIGQGPWIEAQPTIYYGFHTEAIFEMVLICKGYMLLKKRSFREARSCIKLAGVIQQRMSNACFFRLQNGLSDDLMIMNPLFEARSQLLKEIKAYTSDTPSHDQDLSRALSARIESFKRTFKDSNKLFFDFRGSPWVKHEPSFENLELFLSAEALPKGLKEFFEEPTSALDQSATITYSSGKLMHNVQVSAAKKYNYHLPESPQSFQELSTGCENHDWFLGLEAGKTTYGDNEEALSQRDYEFLCSEVKEFLTIRKFSSINFLKELWSSERRSLYETTYIRSSLQQKKDQELMERHLENDKKSLQWSAQLIELYSKKRYKSAQNILIKARLAHRGAFDPYTILSNFRYYSSLKTDYPAYHLARLNFHNNLTQNECFRIDKIPFESSHLRYLTIDGLMECSDITEILHFRLNNPPGSGWKQQSKRSDKYKENEHKGLADVIRYLRNAVALQLKAIKNLREGHLKDSVKLVLKAHQKLLEAHTSHDENQQRSYCDRQALFDPNYQEEYRILSIEVMKIHDTDPSEWLNNSKYTEVKKLQLRRELKSWYEYHQYFRGQLRHALFNIASGHSQKPLSTSESSQVGFLVKKHDQAWREEYVTMFDGLHVDAAKELELIGEGYDLLKEGSFWEALNHFKLARIIQQKVFTSRLLRIKMGLSEELIEDGKYQELYYQVCNLRRRLEMIEGFDLSVNYKYVKNIVISGLKFLVSCIKDSSLIFSQAQESPGIHLEILIELPNSFTDRLKNMEDPNLGTRKACSMVKLMHRSLILLQAGNLGLSFNILQQASTELIEAHQEWSLLILSGHSKRFVHFDQIFEAEFKVFCEGLSQYLKSLV